MSNIYRDFLDLLPPRPRLVGTVTSVSGSVVMLTMPGGAPLRAIGQATVGQRVFVRDGVIEGQAPALTYVEGEA